jgi:hypothetical protein
MFEHFSAWQQTVGKGAYGQHAKLRNWSRKI